MFLVSREINIQGCNYYPRRQVPATSYQTDCQKSPRDSICNSRGTTRPNSHHPVRKSIDTAAVVAAAKHTL